MEGRSLAAPTRALVVDPTAAKVAKAGLPTCEVGVAELEVAGLEVVYLVIVELTVVEVGSGEPGCVG